MYDISIEEVFAAYFECRKTKRYSSGALSFETNYEENLIQLYGELKNGSWKPGRSTCFIVKQPVRREVFAAPFRDRIVHHILINRLNESFEKYFINDSYACRKNKGTHAAIQRVAHFIRSQSDNGKSTAYVLKLDIKGFFMSIDRNLLYEMLSDFLDKNYANGRDISFEKYLCWQIIFSDPCKNCIRKSPESEWIPLPKDKSLFTAKKDCGLPIGNLTSQVFANFYLSRFDHFMKHELGIKCYVRYVDDFVIVHKDEDFLRSVIKKARDFLLSSLKVHLHPKKIYLQDSFKGVSFLGTFVKPNFILISHRIKKNFVGKLLYYSFLAADHRPSQSDIKSFRQTVNSYLGIISHYSTYRFRKKQIVDCLCRDWHRYFNFPVNVKMVKRTGISNGC